MPPRASRGVQWVPPCTASRANAVRVPISPDSYDGNQRGRYQSFIAKRSGREYSASMSIRLKGPWKCVAGEFKEDGIIAYEFDFPIDERFISKAHADLLGAAPDLLEALEMVRDADEDCKKDGLPTIPDAARAKIDRAIAKATPAPSSPVPAAPASPESNPPVAPPSEDRPV